jgi:hypothetical protein
LYLMAKRSFTTRNPGTQRRNLRCELASSDIS